MKKLFLAIYICSALSIGALTSCGSHKVNSAADTTGDMTRPDTASKMSKTGPRGKKDTIGKSDGAGTGPTTGSGASHIDTPIKSNSGK